MSELLTIGEPLIVLKSTEIDKKLIECSSFNKYIAGAELNVCIGLKKLDLNFKYITRLGDDLFGQTIYEYLKKENFSLDYIKILENHKTGLYFKNHVSKGDPDVEYYREDSAINYMNIDDLSEIDYDKFSIGHFTGITASLSKNCYEVVEKLMKKLLKESKIVSFDPNIRKRLWENEEIMKKSLNKLAKLCTIFIPGINEAKLLSGLDDIEEICEFYFSQSENLKIIVIKDGEKGAYVKQRDEKGFNVSAYKVEKVVDTVGAGDGFAAGLISGILKDLSLEESTKRACAIGAMAVMSEGDNDGYPTEQELLKFMEGECNE